MYKILLGTKDILEAEWIRENVAIDKDTGVLQRTLTINIGRNCDEIEKVASIVYKPDAIKNIEAHDDMDNLILGPMSYDEVEDVNVQYAMENIAPMLLVSFKKAIGPVENGG